MSEQWDSEAMGEPLLADRPCGEDLEDSVLLSSVESLRLFGSQVQHDPAPEWTEIKNKAIEGLAKSKDIRLLAHLGAAALRTEGLSGFLQTVTVVSTWLERYWVDVYPMVDEDAILRVNALNCFADPWVVVDAIRRTPLVRSRQHGQVSLRDCDVAAGKIPADEEDSGAGQSQIDAAFADTLFDELQRLQFGVTEGMAAVKQIDATVQAKAGPHGPDLDALSKQLAQVNQVLQAQLELHPGRPVAEPAAGATDSAAASDAGETVSIGGINTREEAIRALDAVAAFFKRTEPSSPIPLLLGRAKRLVSMSFLEVLAELAPEGLSQGKSVGGDEGEQ